MAFKFNPFSGTLDQTGSGGGASYIDGEVQNFSALPETIGTPAVDSAYLVREAEGTWLLARKPAGIYIRTADTGVRAADWTHASAFPDVFSDAAFTVFSDGDSTKNLQLSLSGITTGTTRTLTAPNKSGTIALTTDIPSVNVIELEADGTTTITTAQLPARGIAYADGGASFTVNLPTPDKRQSGLAFSIKTEHEAASGDVFVTVVHAAVNLLTSYELDEDEGSIDFLWDGYAWTYDTAYRLRSFPSRVLQLPAASGTIARTEDFASPPAIGNTTPNTGAFTTLNLDSGATGNLAFRFAADTDTGFFRRGNNALCFVASGANKAEVNATGFNLAAGTGLNWSFNDLTGSNDLTLVRDAANTLAQRRSTAAQTFRLYNTYTSATNHERGFMRWTSNVLQIGTEKAGTGSARALEFQTNGVTRMTISTAGTLTTTASIVAGNNVGAAGTGNFSLAGRLLIRSTANASAYFSGVGSQDSNFDLLGFGGTTSSFPALKRDTTTLQVKLADDSAFTAIQGKLTTETAYTAGAPTATGYLVLYDSNGTAYKVPAEAL
jgi:hypothetical protein